MLQKSYSTLNSMKAELETITKRINTAEKIIQAGIPRKEVYNHIYIPIIYSGYSMGEKIQVYIKDTLVFEKDTRETYKGKYKSYKPTYGKIVIKIKAKDYRRLVAIQNELSGKTEFRTELVHEKEDIIIKSIQKESVIKRNSYLHTEIIDLLK